MYNFLSLMSGLIVALIVSINGKLAESYGVFNSTVIIHIVGVLFAFCICIAVKIKSILQKDSRYGYILAVHSAF